MPSSTSWQRYDEEHNVSAILTEAARACVVENPRDVTDYFARYFREVANGTSVKRLDCYEVMGSHAGPAMAFALELCTGPEVSITTSDSSFVCLHTALKKRVAKRKNSGKAGGENEGKDAADGCAQERYDQLFQTVQSSLLPQLCRLGSVEPQGMWDKVILSAWQAPDAVTLSVQWSLSMLAALAAARQRRITLYQHFSTLLEVPADAYGVKKKSEENKRAATTPVNAAATAVVDTLSNVEKHRGATTTASVVASGKRYAPPRLLVPFLVNDADLHGADATGQVHFARVYVNLEPITYAADHGGDDDEGLSNDKNSNRSSNTRSSNSTGGVAAIVDGTTLRRRMQQLHCAAHLFLTANPTAYTGTEGCVYWGGASSLVELVKAVTGALEAAALRPGVDICIGLSVGANEVRVRSDGEGGEGTIGVANAGSGTTAAATTTNAASSSASSKATAADPSGLYDFFRGDSAITGEQLSEYVKEQLEELGQGVVQLLEDTHSMDDTVARQRLQLALQDSLVLSGNAAFVDKGMSLLNGPAYAEQRTADALAGTYPATVVDLARCGTVQKAVQLLRTVTDAGRSAVTALVGPTAGDAEAAAHLVDLAVAGNVSTLQTSTGPLSATTMSVATRLATLLTELAAAQATTPRVPFKIFNRYDIPPLPEVDVAPIRHKGDKKKKDTQKTSTRKK